jgi:glycerol-3-phosphate acyltransferase PlsY
MAAEILWATFGFALGSIPFGWLLARVRGIDVRRAGSGNIGATNVARTVGWKSGVLTLLADAGKGALAVWLAARYGTPVTAAAWAGLGAVCGHIFSPWLRFRGGKGVATAAGTMAILAPVPLCVAVIAFVATVAISRYVSLGSLVAAAVLPLACWLAGCDLATLVVALASAVLIWFRHRDNIVRLLNATEPRIFSSPN